MIKHHILSPVRRQLLAVLHIARNFFVSTKLSGYEHLDARIDRAFNELQLLRDVLQAYHADNRVLARERVAELWYRVRVVDFEYADRCWVRRGCGALPC